MSKLKRLFLIWFIIAAFSSCYQETKQNRHSEPTSFTFCIDSAKKGRGDSVRFVSNNTISDFSPIVKTTCIKKGNNYGQNDSNEIGIKIILDELNFTDISFTESEEKYSVLKDIYFDKAVRFRNCSFWPDKIYNATFNAPTEFISNDNDLDLIWAKFKDTLRIEDVGYSDTLSGELYFYESDFMKTVQFSGEQSPDDDIRFRNSYMLVIASNIYFDRCNVLRKLEFTNCRFIKENTLIIENTNVDTIIFDGLKLQKTVDLTKVNLSRSKKCNLYLHNVDIEKLKFRYNNFHIYFPDSILLNRSNFEIIDATYQSVLSNFRNNGYEESYEELDKEYKDWKSEHNLFSWISKFWWRYGYEKERILIVIFYSLLIFSFINFLFYERLLSTYYIKSLDWKEMPFVQSKQMKWFKRCVLCFFYTCLIFFKLSIDFDKVDFSKTFLSILLFTQYTIGLLCTGYLINWVISN